MNYRGWMFIGFSKQFPKGRIKARTYMNEPCLVFRTMSGELCMVEPHCSHFGVDMRTGRVVKELIQCPMHGRVFRGDGRCGNPRRRAIRAWPVEEHGGLAFAYFDEAGVAPRWAPPRFLEGETPDVLWHHHRDLELHHPSVPLDNSVDPRHFEYTHTMFGKCLEDGRFEPRGHRAVGTMATEITPPLSYVTGQRAAVTTWFDGPLNTLLKTEVGDEITHLCNFLTIVEGKRCRLTQVGVGRRTRSPVARFRDAIGWFGSWYATYEDALVWNDRKPQPIDHDPHATDEALAAFRAWFDGFGYRPVDPCPVEEASPRVGAA